MSVALFNLGEVAAAQNNHSAATLYYQESLAVAEDIGFSSLISLCAGGLGQGSAARGDAASARRYLQRALAQAAAIGSLTNQLYALVGFARLKVLLCEHVQAAEWLGLTLAHPSSDTDVLQRGQALLATLRGAVPAEQLEAALERGKALELQDVVEELLAEKTGTGEQGT
jgi:hypothetical protein